MHYAGIHLLWVVAMAIQGEATYVSTSVLKQSDFDDGTMTPFVPCNVESPSFVSISTAESKSKPDSLETYFDESTYWTDETRDRRGAEFCTGTSDDESTYMMVHKEGWQGFSFYLPSSWPDDKDAIFAQQFCPGYCSSWCAMVSFVDGQLIANHRSACGAATEGVIASSISRDTWQDVIIDIRFSNIGDGHYVVWYDNAIAYDASSINIGFDDSWTTNGSLLTGAYFKNGQYDYDPDTYTNTTRTLYFDNVSWYNVDDGASDGYDVVDPSKLP